MLLTTSTQHNHKTEGMNMYLLQNLERHQSSDHLSVPKSSASLSASCPHPLLILEVMLDNEQGSESRTRYKVNAHNMVCFNRMLYNEQTEALYLEHISTAISGQNF